MSREVWLPLERGGSLGGTQMRTQPIRSQIAHTTTTTVLRRCVPVEFHAAVCGAAWCMVHGASGLISQGRSLMEIYS